jgi:hypothetical protein
MLPLDLGESAILSVTDDSQNEAVMNQHALPRCRLAGQYCSVWEIEGSVASCNPCRPGRVGYGSIRSVAIRYFLA